MKPHGKGPSLSITAPNRGGTSNMNHWKHMVATAAEGVPVREFKPLHLAEHPRQREMDEYRALPSQYN